MPDLRWRVGAFRARHSEGEYRLLRRGARRLGYHLVPANYYSPIPDLETIPQRVWSDPAAMPGVSWDLTAQLTWLRAELEPRLGEFGAGADPPGTAEGYYYRNRFFNALDADLLYAIIRNRRPPRVLEVGSGFSTLAIERAATRNRDEGAPLRHDVFDAFPSGRLGPVRDRLELHAVAAETIPVAAFAELQGGDVLFIDTTHAVRPGGDVVHLLLDALPRVAPGVLVHIHDFFRPFEYPRTLMERYGVFWQEHHLVQALLCGSDAFEILCANYAVTRLHPAAVRELIPGLDSDMAPSSLWLRRR
jgi:hypothetical protein